MIRKQYQLGEYRVKWEIDLTATSPEEAAKIAEWYQKTSSGVFDVTDEEGKTTQIDCLSCRKVEPYAN